MFLELTLQNCQHPLLTQDVVDGFAKQGIRKLRDFLNHTDKDLAALSGLKVNQVIALRHDLVGKYSGQNRNALQLINNLKEEILRTGVEKVDAILDGGFKSGCIYELFGPPSSGKTQMALTVSAVMAVQHKVQSNVIYFDTKGDFKIDRFVQILQRRNEETKSGISIAKCLDRLRAKKVLDLTELCSSLETIACLVAAGGSKDKFWSKVNLLVVDNIASLVLPLLYTEDNLKVVFGETAKVICLLKKLAHDHNLCILVVNHSTLKPGEEGKPSIRQPSLGKIFSSAANTRMLMVREDEQGHGDILLSLTKTPSLIQSRDEEKKCKVKIEARGIVGAD